MIPLLEVRDLSVAYGGIEAVRGLSFSVPEGSIVSLIGANGAGKTSTLLAVSGLVRPRAGRILFDGQDITGRRADRIVRAGIAHVPEGRAILEPLSVAENLDLGGWILPDRRSLRRAMDRVFDLFPRLAERRRQMAGSLSGGEQQMLAIGRALMVSPRLLLLDEPSMGLAPLLVARIFHVIENIHRSGTTVLLVEQNARQALRISQRAVVLSHGLLLRDGESRSLLSDPVIVEAFLGKA
ncbi:MAG TPA: ABC transporter ATP-binding protein [Spirochaetia bacterium]|nr:ABC transporter ATP-binding protein [Spirochaetia bacterium]